MKIFQAGGVSTATTSRKIRVGINPLALLKMDGTSKSGLACGCASVPINGKGSVYPQLPAPEEMPSPLPAMPHPFSASLEDQSLLKAGRPAAEGSECKFPPLKPMVLDLAPLAALSSAPHQSIVSPASSPKFSLPPIRPSKSKKAFDSL